MASKRLSRRITQSQLWRSIVRHGAADTPRTRSLTVVSNFFLHLHPASMPRHALRYRFTWGLGGISFLLFFILVVTGVLLMFYYVPDVDRAYNDMKDLRFAVPFGVFLRNMHRWSAHAMVMAVILHMMRVFYTASYRPPREFNWVIGVMLLVLTLLLSFTGYLLPWDQLAYWAITVGTNMARSTPFIGHTGPFHELLGVQIDNDIRYALLGGTEVGQNALIRFYVAHDVALPALMGLLLAVHFWRIRKDGGISRPKSGPPSVAPAGRAQRVESGESRVESKESSPSAPHAPLPTVDSPRYRLLAYVKGETYSGKRDLAENEVQVWPHLVVREFMAAVTVIVLLWIVSLFFNAPLEAQANPAVTPNPAKAPWYFVGLQELLVYFDPWIAGVMIPGIIVFGLAAIPYLDFNREGVGEYAFGRRKFAVIVLTFGIVLWFTLIFIGLFMRGPSWAWYWPAEDWTIPKETVSTAQDLPVVWGGLLLAGYFALGLVLPAIRLPKFRRAVGLRRYLVTLIPQLRFSSFYRALGLPRYLVTMILLLLMIGIPAKILLRLALDVKYILATPWFNI